MKYVGFTLLFMLGVVAFWGLIYGIRWVTAAPKGALNAREGIQSAPNRIAAYNHFFDLCAGVRADEASLDAQTTLLTQATDSFQRSRVQTNISGLIGHRASLIEEYNTKARTYTSGQFRDSGLPYQLSPEPHKAGESTSCGY